MKWKAPVSGPTRETRLQIAADVESPVVTIAWPTAAYRTPDDAELDVVASLLSGNRVGWLRWRLVDELRIASRVTAGQSSRGLGSAFAIRAVAQPGHTAAELVDAIDQTLWKLQSAPPDGYSAEGAVSEVALRMIFRFEPAVGRARAFDECVDFDLSGDCIGTILEPFLTITPLRLKEVAALELPLGKRIVAEVTPTPGAPRAGVLVSRSVVP